MSSIAGNNTVWAVVVVIVLPAAIIAASEFDERLRQRESVLRRAVVALRMWALPFFAMWALLVPVLGSGTETTVVRLVASGLVLSLAAVGLALLRIVIADLRRRGGTDDRRRVPELLLALPRIGVVVVTGWILVDSVWGIDLSAALTALGVTSLVVSFALQDTLSGLASGVLLLGDQPFQPGDWITSGDAEGVVIDINWRTTRIRDRDGDMLIIPNAQLANATVVNHTSPDPLTRVVVPLQVAFKNPPTRVREMLLDAARATPGVLEMPEPEVRVVQIDDPLMGYEAHLWIDDFTIEPKVRADFGALVWYQSHRHDVPLPSPAQDLYLYDAATTPGDRDFGPEEIHRGLQRSPLLASLSDAELDRLAGAVRPLRFAAGEIVVDSDHPTGDLSVLVEGEAGLLVDHNGITINVADVRIGEVLGVLTGESLDGDRLVVRAVTDCEVLRIGGAAAAEIGSRNAAVAEALQRVSAIRRRRVQRVLERESDLAASSDDEPLS